MSIVENIKMLCKQANTTIPKLGVELGFGNGAIYNWDKSSPSIDKVQKVANYFRVSVDRVLYGFDLSEFTNMVCMIKGDRTIEQFSKDTGIDISLMFDICLGLQYERPTRELIQQLMSSNPIDYIVSEEDLLEAAGYITNRQNEEVKRQFIEKLISQFDEAGFTVRIENEDHYEKAYIEHRNHGTLMGMFLHEFIDRGPVLLDELKRKYQTDDIQTIAAHHDGEDWTEEELEEIEKFKEFVRMKRKLKQE